MNGWWGEILNVVYSGGLRLVMIVVWNVCVWGWVMFVVLIGWF